MKEKGKKLLNIMLKVLGVFFLIGMVAMILPSKEEETIKEIPVEVVEPKVLSPVEERLPSTFREPFLEGCTEDGTSREFCVCALKYLDENFSLSELLAVDTEQDSDGVILEASLECIDYY